MLYLAGEDSKDAETQEVYGKDVPEQLKFLFESLSKNLTELGSSLEHIVKVTVYLKNKEDRPAYAKEWGKYLPHGPPNTLVMGVDLAEPEMLVEVDAIAVIPNA
jgi:2-iminobutanoate/2-iminopropanoate deaminase